MTEARFIIDSSGEAAQNPDFEVGVLSLAEGATTGVEYERIEALKLAVWGSRAVQRAELRIARGLLLEAAPEDRESLEDEKLKEMPTGVFEIVAAQSDDPKRMERIRVERKQKKEETEAERERREAVEAEQSRLSAHRHARQRLEGRRSGGDKR